MIPIAAALLVTLFAGEIASIEALLFVVTLLGFGGARRHKPPDVRHFLVTLLSDDVGDSF